MNKIKSPILEPISILFSIASNCAAVFVCSKVPIMMSPFIMLGTNVFIYATTYGRFYQFEYDHDKLIVTNLWNPFLHSEYNIRGLTKISIEYHNSLGFAVEVFFDNKKDVYGSPYSNLSDLKKMEKEINENIENFHVEH